MLSFPTPPPLLKIFVLLLLFSLSTSEKYSYFLVSISKDLFLPLYFSVLTASISLSPLIPSCLQGFLELPDFKTTFLNHDKTKTMVIILSPTTLLPNLWEERAITFPHFSSLVNVMPINSRIISKHHILLSQYKWGLLLIQRNTLDLFFFHCGY